VKCRDASRDAFSAATRFGLWDANRRADVAWMARSRGPYSRGAE